MTQACAICEKLRRDSINVNLPGFSTDGMSRQKLFIRTKLSMKMLKTFQKIPACAPILRQQA